MKKHSEQKVWDKILEQHGLSLNRGSSPSWLSYGWAYSDSTRTVDYSTDGKKPHKKTAANLLRAKQMLELMEKGLSIKKAGASLGIPQRTACYIIKRYRELSTLANKLTHSEGDGRECE